MPEEKRVAICRVRRNVTHGLALDKSETWRQID